MALSDRKLELIEKRLVETERTQTKLDWSVCTPRAFGAFAFGILMLAVLLAPYDDLSPRVIVGQGLLVAGFVSLYGFYLWRFRPELLLNRRKQVLFGASVLIFAAITQVTAGLATDQAPEMFRTAFTPAVLFSLMMLCGIVYSVVFDQRFALDGLVLLSVAVTAVLLRIGRFEPVSLALCRRVRFPDREDFSRYFTIYLIASWAKFLML